MTIPAQDYVVFILLENKAPSSVIVAQGAPVGTAPYINNTLLPLGCLLKGYSAVSHPSAPNYLALMTGSLLQAGSDAYNTYSNNSLLSLLDTAGKKWAFYQEDMTAGAPQTNVTNGVSSTVAGTNGQYVFRHDPAGYLTYVLNNSTRKAQIKTVTDPFTTSSVYTTDFGTLANTPNFSFITPAIPNDGHAPGTVTSLDTWCKNNIPTILASKAFTTVGKHALLVLVFDEGSRSSPTDVSPSATVCVMVGTDVKTNFSVTTAYTHYGLLATVETAFGLGNLGTNDVGATQINDVWIATGAVGHAPLITSAAQTTFTVGTAGTFKVTTTGDATITLTKTGSLPTGVTFTDNGDGTATIAGTPAVGSLLQYSITITAHNATAPDATQTFTLTAQTFTRGVGCVGMFDRQGNGGSSTVLNNNPDSAHQGILSGFLATDSGSSGGLAWSLLQTTDGGAIASNNAIDAALTLCAAVNARQTRQWVIKLRIMAGEWAPDWAKAKSGGPISDGAGNTMGPYWCQDYRTSFKDFMNKLATKYDGNALIGNVVVSMCMDTFAEPLLKQHFGSGTGRTNVLKTGVYQVDYTKALDIQAQKNSMTDAILYWKKTPVSFSFNPADDVVAGTSGDVATTNLLIDYFVQNIPSPQGTLENNSLRANGAVIPGNKPWATSGTYLDPHGSTPPGNYTNMYTHLAGYADGAAADDLNQVESATPSPMHIQTSAYSGMGGTPASLQNTMEYAIWLGARMVELPSQYTSVLTSSQLDAYNPGLANNQVPVSNQNTVNLSCTMSGTGVVSPAIKSGSTTLITASM